MSEKNSLFYFMDGLKDWARVELERRNVQDLNAAIAEAEALKPLLHPIEGKECQPRLKWGRQVRTKEPRPQERGTTKAFQHGQAQQV
ncbi:hypothetical protein Dsin_017094 [Dipteronia sinensis]|uniref:Uncharacterized protein n=1 Tax=Dipteronia sinensis TaxID=43782 RepID=A0AAE0AF48_9ROSI|nr:hypothetical protein Dsin_017094 [Dipteronia sinensis]